jgi:hypothetical protein
MSWNDFNNAEDQNSFDPLPKGTLVKVRMTIKPGGHNNEQKGWTGGYATRNATSGAVYLNAEFVVLEGQYARRKIWSLIGLHSEKGEEWANIGRSLIKGILNSARGIGNKDNSPAAQNARRINGLGDLDGIEFLARVDMEKDQNGNDKNVIKYAVTSDNKEYAALMGRGGYTAAPAAAVSPSQPQKPAGNMPSWAQ